jgi:hypothetical protein
MPEQNMIVTAGAVAPAGPVEVFLEGGPTNIPRSVMATAEEFAYGKVKVPYLAGYEHFERGSEENDGNSFSWTTRTKIAE